jgi:MATE family multidrug resistance protein
LPIVIGQLGIIFVSFADTFMVGHHGKGDLAAAGFVNNVFNLVIIFATGFSYGLTPIIGKLFGCNEKRKAGGVLRNALFANSVMSAILMVIMWLLYLNIDRLGQPVELLGLMRPYHLTLLISIPFILLFNAFRQFADGITDTKTSMWILLTGNMLNILGNYLLIFGKMGCPELGLVGAGVATLTSRVFMVVALFVVLLKSKRYEAYLDGLRLPFTSRGVKHLTRKGMPIGLQMCMEASSFSLCAVMMGWLGSAPLAAHQVMCTIGSLCFMVYYGIGAAVAIRISHFRGQGNWGEVRLVANVGLLMTLSTGVLLSTMIFLLRYDISYMFTTSEEVVAVVVSLIVPMMFYQLGDCIQTVFANALRAIEDVKMMMFYAFIAYVVVSLPLSYVFGFILGWGAVGVWWAYPFGLTTAGVLFWTRFNKTTCQKCR